MGKPGWGTRARSVLYAMPHMHMTVVRDGGHVLIWFEDMVINLLKGELQKAMAKWRRTTARW